MIINIERDKAYKLLCACTEIQYYYEGLAEHADDEDVREIHERNAFEWRSIHDVLKAQLEKGGDVNEKREKV